MFFMYVRAALDLGDAFLATLPRAKGFEELTGDGGYMRRLIAKRKKCRDLPEGTCRASCWHCEKIVLVQGVDR
jgi:hypothetical protein